MLDKYNIKSSLFYIIISLFIFIQYSLYNNYSRDVFTYTNYIPFIASSNNIDNLFITIYSIISDTSFQFFGLFSYIIILSLFIRGILIFFNTNSNKKHQFIFTLLFIITGTVILNVISTYPLFQKILQVHKLDYYAGGYIGYALSKIVFMDILKQNTLYKWQLVILFILWLWSIQYVCLFSYKCGINKLFSKICKLFKSKKIHKKVQCKEQHNKKNRISNRSSNNKHVPNIINTIVEYIVGICLK